MIRPMRRAACLSMLVVLGACGTPTSLRSRAPTPPKDYAVKVQQRLDTIFQAGSFDSLRVTTPRPAIMWQTVTRYGRVISEDATGTGYAVCARFSQQFLMTRQTGNFIALFDNEGNVARGQVGGGGCAELPEESFTAVEPPA